METIRKNLFTHALGHLEFGLTSDEIDQKLHEAIKAAQHTGKNAEVTVKLTVKPSTSGVQVFIVADIKAKIPRLPREQTIFFPTEDGNLLRNDPRQNNVPGMKIAEDERPTEFRLAK